METMGPESAAPVSVRGAVRGARFARGTLLRDVYPHLVPLLHPDRNPGMDLATLTAGSGIKLWWKCPEGDDHEWSAVVSNMTRPNSRCPFCSGRRVSVTNSLAACYEEVAAEWHPTANGARRPDQIVFGSNDRAWWQCSSDGRHQWETQIVSRTTDGTRCPYCTNKRASPTNNLDVLYPRVAEQWHPVRNGSLTPVNLPAGSATVVWWACPAGADHEWSTRVVNRTTGRHGCPFCANQKPSVTNSLAMLFPDAASQLDPELNENITADEVIAGSNKRRWWRCPAGPDHVWLAMPRERTFGNTNCPACSGSQVSVTNSLATLFPGVAAEWHPTKNGNRRAENVTAYSNKLVWWQCRQDPHHEWPAPPNNRTRGGNGCPGCANKRLSPTNNLAFLHRDLAAQFDPALNGGVTADKVVAASGERAVWRCPEGPDHVWTQPVRDRTARDAGCPACHGRQLSVTNSLADRFPQVADQWHPTRNGDMTPAQVIGTSSTVRVWWVCDQGPDHEWATRVHQRTVVGTGCPCCAGLQLSVTNSLAARFPTLAEQWHPTRNGDLTPDRIVAGSGSSVWWQCPVAPDHEWPATLDKRTGQEATGCPACDGTQVSVTNSLATLFPTVAQQLDPLLNDGRTPDRVMAGSAEKIWWRCPAGPDHIWAAAVYSRTSAGRGCPCCAGMRVSVTNSLQARFPEIATELDPDLNDGLTADQVAAGTHLRVVWRCRKVSDHQWTTAVSNRTAGDTNCPTCAVRGYSPARPGYLYLLRRTFDGREQRKIGITNVPKDRLAKLRRFGWQPIEVSEALDGLVAREREQAFLAVLIARGLRNGRKQSHSPREDGYTETWDYTNLPVDSLADVKVGIGYTVDDS
ncbi:zinc-ribbon domain-containing protein [Catellatospora citrea]|uniref:zinc-ribbon domain-containing protein n=1 Tax=Catellatospora citrea TaxID=53366 RepID=UPI0033C88300